jgi:hypothetical protein
MSTAAPVFDPQQLIVSDPVVGRAAERAFLTAGATVLPPLELLGQDAWDSVPRVARLVGASPDLPVERLEQLLFDESANHGASMAFRFVGPGRGRGLGPLLSARRGDEIPWMLIRAIGEYGDAHDAPLLLTEAKRRNFEQEVVREVLKALERMLLAQRDAKDAELVFRTFRDVIKRAGRRVDFPLHPTWHVFRLESGWLDPVLNAFSEAAKARMGWSERAATWLGMSHAKRAVSVLGRVAADPAEPPKVKIAALEALADNAQEGALEATARAASVAGPTGAPGLPAAVDSAAAQLAWQSTDPAQLAWDQIRRAAETGNHIAYANALYTLGRSGGPDSEEEIDRALVHDEWPVRGAAGVALAVLRGRDAVERLDEARNEASEPIERLELIAALARADPERHGDELHAALCTREVTAPWALVNPIRQAIVDAFDAGGPDATERREAWAEVLNMAPVVAPVVPRAASPGEVMPEPAVKAAPPPPPPPPTPPPPVPEPGRGTPNAQADTEAMVDRLGRAPLVDILVGMLDDKEQGTPFTFGLFGGWGEGKSSVLRQLQTRLESEDRNNAFWIAWFNAWQYERTDNLAAGLVQETVRELVPKGLWARLGLAWKFAWRTQRARLLGAIAILVASAAAAVLGLVAGVFEGGVAKAVVGAGGLSVLSVIGAVLVRLYRHPVATELWTYFRLPDYAAQLGLLPVMREQLHVIWDITRKGREDSARLVVVVDDLDRCSPAAIAATLDAVRLVMDMEGVVVIVALDERICLRAVAEEYQDLTTPERSETEIARDFLAKIVQLPVRLERPESLEEFLQYELFGTRPREAAPEPELVGPVATHNGDGASAEAVPDAPPDAEAFAQARVRGGEGIYTAEDASAAASRLQREAMRDTSDELKEFERVARASDIHNPRQLRRLRNTYRFIKTSSASLDWRKLMVMLFWQDCLHMLPSSEFPKHQGRPSSGRSKPATVPTALADLTAELFEDDAEFQTYRRAVLIAVLPRLDVSTVRG